MAIPSGIYIAEATAGATVDVTSDATDAHRHDGRVTQVATACVATAFVSDEVFARYTWSRPDHELLQRAIEELQRAADQEQLKERAARLHDRVRRRERNQATWRRDRCKLTSQIVRGGPQHPHRLKLGLCNRF